MDWNKLEKSLLFPPIPIMIILVPISTVLLVGSMVFVGTESPIAIISYVLSAYTLTIWCFKLPYLIKYFKELKDKNIYIVKWRADTRLRVNVSLYGSLGWNTLYGLFQLWLGFYHHTFWFYSLGAYYICLAVMRFYLVRHTRKFAPGEKMKTELIKYRACGWIFLLMNLSLSLIIFFMLYWDRTFKHHMITAIAIAAYTFTAFTTAIINMIRYRKYNSPIFSASKIVSFAAACVSMLTLTSTLLTTFNDGSMDPFSLKILLGCVGIAVSGTVVSLAVYMIIQGTKKIKLLSKHKEQTHGKQ